MVRVVKHVLYQNLSKPITIGGMPRIGVVIATVFSVVMLPLGLIFLDSLPLGLIGAIVSGGLWWAGLAIQAYRDPDMLLIQFNQFKIKKTVSVFPYKGQRYAA